jgi:Asp-tRNA(Asn)/Glu-tRNA(Gln) amidotransferase A subunit family amidase
MCRYAEDCAIVLSVIARPDDRDLTVQDVPFNWNAQFDIKRLRFGYIKEAFDEVANPVAKASDEKTLKTLRSLGLSLIPVKVPQFSINVSAYPVEWAVFFDHALRSGLSKKFTLPARDRELREGRVIPAVEYVQSQRARMVMMMQLSDATKDVDVWIAPGNAATAGTTGGRGGAPGTPPGTGRGNQTIAGRHSSMAQHACYPAAAVPNGFTERGFPTSITFFARPFGESELLAVVKAYQDATGYHLKHPAV